MRCAKDYIISLKNPQRTIAFRMYETREEKMLTEIDYRAIISELVGAYFFTDDESTARDIAIATARNAHSIPELTSHEIISHLGSDRLRFLAQTQPSHVRDWLLQEAAMLQNA